MYIQAQFIRATIYKMFKIEEIELWMVKHLPQTDFTKSHETGGNTNIEHVIGAPQSREQSRDLLLSKYIIEYCSEPAISMLEGCKYIRECM